MILGNTVIHVLCEQDFPTKV